jgi:hypothetical protein
VLEQLLRVHNDEDAVVVFLFGRDEVEHDTRKFVRRGRRRFCLPSLRLMRRQNSQCNYRRDVARERPPGGQQELDCALDMCACIALCRH